MDNLIDAVLKLLHFEELLIILGIGKKTGAVLFALAIIIFGAIIKKTIIILNSRYRNTIAAKNLKPQFDYITIKEALRYYISTKYQMSSPTEKDEPKNSINNDLSKPLIPFLLREVFNEKYNHEKFYIILADSGMGKTTFMINLYMKYVSFFNLRQRYKIRLLRLSNYKTLDWVKNYEIEEKR